MQLSQNKNACCVPRSHAIYMSAPYVESFVAFFSWLSFIVLSLVATGLEVIQRMPACCALKELTCTASLRRSFRDPPSAESMRDTAGAELCSRACCLWHGGIGGERAKEGGYGHGFNAVLRVHYCVPGSFYFFVFFVFLFLIASTAKYSPRTDNSMHISARASLSQFVD